MYALTGAFNLTTPVRLFCSLLILIAYNPPRIEDLPRKKS